MECSISKGMTPSNITTSINTILMLNGSNFNSWKENLEIVLGVMDLDLALGKILLLHLQIRVHLNKRGRKKGGRNLTNSIQETVTEKQTPTPPKPWPLRRSTRERRNDYIVFLQEHEVDIGMMENDPINFYEAMECSNSQKWIDAINEEIKSMKNNDIWELVPLPQGVKPIDCK
ncbi:hypothetical protein Sango_2327700 [Sesamum angolense]|uniref:Retrotransposon Copia-like N-terminal domain-containing protein n=1 Tax=Sesamum angolense TaxID=2727404 RepID=A0AAE1WAU2_9LAMI|nr:hypothetical protein Sango_2327700 [Sesamum angolense]